MQQQMQEQPHAEMIRHGRQALILLIAFSFLLVSIIYSIFNSINPEGTYVYAYEISADGKKETGKSSEYHLKSGGKATYETADLQLDGTWTKSGKTITITIKKHGGKFKISGDTLTQYCDDGRRVIYKKD